MESTLIANPIELVVKRIDMREIADACFAGLDVSEETKKDYLYRIRHFLSFIGTHELNRGTFLEYKRSLKARGDLSVAAKNKYLVCARILLKELHRRGSIASDITGNVRSFQQTRKHKKDGLTSEDMERLSAYLRELPASKESERIRAMFALLIFQGIRTIEAVRLDAADVDLVGKTANITGKGRDDQEAIDLHPECVKALKAYIETNEVKDDRPLFVSHDFTNKSKRLSTRGFQFIIAKILKAAGIKNSPHGLRHHFVTKLVDSYKGDLLQVQRLTRHRSLEMLRVYDDRQRKKEDLPRYYATFDAIRI